MKEVKVHAAVVVLMALCGGVTPLALEQQQPAAADLDVVALLELYESGRFDDAIARITAAGDRESRALRTQLRTEGSEWIDKARPNHARRLLVTAALALELEVLRVERNDWGSSNPTGNVFFHPSGRFRPIILSPSCQGACMLEWARTLLVERGSADAAVRAWFHGALALTEGHRDWRNVYTLLGPEAPAPGRALAHEAITAFPDEPWFQFDRALAMAARYNVTRDGVAPGSAAIAPAETVLERVVSVGRFQTANRTVTRMRLGAGQAPETGTANMPFSQPVSALEELVRLSSDPVVGVDAQIRLGYLHWATGNSDAAQTTLKTAAEVADTADRRYLAHFLAGWIALRDGRDDAARESLAGALEARPNSQSATLALASLELKQGDADIAHARAESSLAERPRDDDPWRLFLYGRFPDLSRLIAEMRERVRR
jgi:tetratricopeptide (TPR) repeat protein